MEKRKNTQPIRTAFTYVIFGALWILLTDRILEIFFPAEHQTYTLLQTIKGWLFVCASALLIYLVLRRDISTLAESEQRYKLLFDNNPNPMWVYDAETLRFLTVNDAAIDHYGYTREEFLAMTLKDIRPEEDVTALMANVAVQTATLQRSDGWKHRKKDGTLIDVEISSHSLKFGERSARLVLAHDVTKKKAAEQALKKSEVQFRTLVEQLPAITYIAALDEISSTLYISPQVEELLGIPADEYIKKPALWFEHIHPQDRERILEKIRQNHEEGNPFAAEYRMIADNGRIIWFQDEGNLVRNENGEPLFLEGVMYDITERKTSAEKLAYQAELLSNVHDAIVGTDAEFHITYWNKTAEEVFGWTEQEALGKFSKELFKTQVPGSSREEKVQQLMSNGRYAGEVLYMRKDGVYINADIRTVVLKDDDGNVRGVLSSIRDATERKQAELTLRRNEHILREAQTIAKLGSWTADLKAGLFYVNAETAQLMGWPIGIQPQEVLLKAAHPDDRAMVEAMWAEAQQSGRDYDIEHRIIVNGSVRWVHATAKITYSEEGNPLSAIGILQDITERRMAEEALKVSEENYRNLAETSDSAIAVLNRDGRILYANPASIRIWNDPRLIGKTIQDLYPKEFANKYLSVVHRVIDEQTTDLNELESEVNGQTMWFRASMSPLKSSDGTVSALLLNALDITDRKQAELALQLSEERFRTALDNMLEGIQFLSFDWRYLYLNAAAEKHNRRPNQELMGHVYMEMWPGIAETHVFAVIQRCMEERNPQQLQTRIHISRWACPLVRPEHPAHSGRRPDPIHRHYRTQTRRGKTTHI
jgi:PAS domain S-box-containing protein